MNDMTDRLFVDAFGMKRVEHTHKPRRGDVVTYVYENDTHPIYRYENNHGELLGFCASDVVYQVSR